MQLPGIVFFAFNRPELTERCLTALARDTLAPDCDVTIYCDGPRDDQDLPLVTATREVAQAAKGFKSLRVVEREENYGCAASVINGITQSFDEHERLAIFEDDILISPHTLTFLTACLEKYETFPAVFSISAWSPPPSLLKIPQIYPFDAYFVPRCNIWGWATWKDRWQKIDWSVSDYPAFSNTSVLQKAFNAGGEDLSPMLRAQVTEKTIDSWAIRMDYARFKHGCLGLNPVRSYTTNIGFGSGTHTTTATTRWDNDISQAPTDPRLPDHVFVDTDIQRAYRSVYDSPPLHIRAINKLGRALLGKNLLDR